MATEPFDFEEEPAATPPVPARGSEGPGWLKLASAVFVGVFLGTFLAGAFLFGGCGVRVTVVTPR